MRRVAAQLDGGRGYEAVRLFLDAVAHEAMPRHVPLGVWISETLDEDSMRSLVTALAHFPCFGCKGGYEPCRPCAASGFSSVRQVCAACIGFGVARCDFCNASGLATYNLIPAELRYRVLQTRVAIAVRHVRKLTDADADSSTGSPPRVARLRQGVLDLNKLLGVLENALLVWHQTAESEGEQGKHRRSIDMACRDTAHFARVAMRQMLKGLAEAHERAAKQSVGIAAEAATDLGEYYDVLYHGDRFAGTLLGHPFLCRSDLPDPAPVRDADPPPERLDENAAESSANSA